MSAIYPNFGAIYVPYRHKVNAAAAVSAPNLALDGPQNPYPKDDARASSHQKMSPRCSYSAQNAASGFAVHILVEADMTGSDPFVSARGAKAYQGREIIAPALRLIA